MIQIDVTALSFVVGVLIPLLVALLTKVNASRTVKAVLNLGLSAIAGAVVVAIQASGNINVQNLVVGVGTTWIASIVSYYGVHDPTGSASAVAGIAPNVGLGAPATPPYVPPAA